MYIDIAIVRIMVVSQKAQVLAIGPSTSLVLCLTLSFSSLPFSLFHTSEPLHLTTFFSLDSILPPVFALLFRFRKGYGEYWPSTGMALHGGDGG